MKLRLLPHLILLILSLLIVQGCTPSAGLLTTGNIDPTGGLSREDYMALRNRQKPNTAEAEKKTSIPPIPKMPEEESDAVGSNPLLDKRVSVTVTDTVPVRDVLMELVRKTGANLELDPRVQGSVILTAHDQPFGQILKRVCTMANLRYTIDGAFIHIEPDDPYQKSYRLDYLSLARKTSSNTSIATNVFDVDVGANGTTSGASGNGNLGSTSTENNSTAKVSGTSDADFWAETEKSIAQILGAGESKSNGKANFSIDKQAGMVTVYGTQKQQQAIEKYFVELRRKADAQVLIDARIIEVELDDGYQSGIDWNGVFKNTVGIASNFGTQAALNANGVFTASVTGTSFNSMINLVQTFGTTRVLSAPRITVLNNQTAVMKVATNQVYFVTQAQFTTTTNASGASITTNPIYTSTPRTVPVGLVMTVQPSIDAEHNRVTMTLRPTISRVVGEVNDPSISLNAAVAGVTTSVQSQIPVLAVREMDSVIQLHSGEIAIMGGLMQDSSINTDQGVPGMADIPYAGNLFKSRDNEGKTSELVILLRATIADQPAPDKADSELYQHYNNDPRPMEIPSAPAKPSANDNDDDSDSTL
ncbi:MAG: secretin N-terminal domain-containing protein [Alphaproteobacteria bacterium]|nr:secretin N-terminal domain-containing protein [Alphaproteobacteria bacterium]